MIALVALIYVTIGTNCVLNVFYCLYCFFAFSCVCVGILFNKVSFSLYLTIAYCAEAKARLKGYLVTLTIIINIYPADEVKRILSTVKLPSYFYSRWSYGVNGSFICVVFHLEWMHTAEIDCPFLSCCAYICEYRRFNWIFILYMCFNIGFVLNSCFWRLQIFIF